MFVCVCRWFGGSAGIIPAVALLDSSPNYLKSWEQSSVFWDPKQGPWGLLYLMLFFLALCGIRCKVPFSLGLFVWQQHTFTVLVNRKREKRLEWCGICHRKELGLEWNGVAGCRTVGTSCSLSQTLKCPYMYPYCTLPFFSLVEFLMLLSRKLLYTEWKDFLKSQDGVVCTVCMYVCMIYVYLLNIYPASPDKMSPKWLTK